MEAPLSGGIVNFKRIVDVFDGTSTSFSMYHRPGVPLCDYLVGLSSADLKCFVSGSLVDLNEYEPQIGEEICIYEAPGWSVGIAIIVSIILAAGSYLLQRSMMPTVPSNDSFGQGDGQFGGIQTLSAGGIPLPICYGQVRGGGNIVDSFETGFIDKNLPSPEDVAASQALLQDNLFGFHFAEDFFKTNILINFDEELRRSRSALSTRVVYCAGPIESIIEDSVLIDRRPISHYPGLEVHSRLGLQHQESIPGFNQATSTVTLNLPVSNGSPGLFSTLNDVDEIEVVLDFPKGMYQVGRDGFKRSSPVFLTVEIKPTGQTTYELVGNFSVKDYAPHPQQYRLRINDLIRQKYDIRITRLTADDVGDVNFSEFVIFFVNEIVFEDRTHPGVAQLAFRQLPGDQLSSINPTNYTAIIKGFNNIRTYTSDTEFTTGWTDNPAWCCGHFLTSKLNGMGTVFDWDDIDIPSFIEWGKHCDEMVQDGRGGLEKRATFNRLYDASTTAQEIIQDFATGTGASLLYTGAKFGVVIDKTRPTSQIFSEANVTDGKFSRVYFPKAELATRVTVNFKNLEIDYENDAIMQEDPNVASGLFQKGLSVEMLHITRPGQAAREARRIALSNAILTSGIEFSAGIQAANLKVGDHIEVSSVGLGIGLGSGLLTRVEANQKTMQLDDNIAFDSTKSYIISIQHQFDGAIDVIPIVNPGDVTTHIVETINDHWTRTLQSSDKYAIGEVASHVKDYRVDATSISGFGDKFEVKVRAGIYDEALFNLDPESNEEETPGEIPNRDSVPGKVNNLRVSFRPAEVSSIVGRRSLRTIEVTWDPPDSWSVDHYVVIYRTSGTVTGSWDISTITQGTYHEITNGIVIGEKYRVAVIAVSPGGLQLPISLIDTTIEVEVY